VFAAAYIVVVTDCHSAVAAVVVAACSTDFDRTVAALEAGNYFETGSHSVAEVGRTRPVADSYFGFAAAALAAYSAGFVRSAALGAGSHTVAERPPAAAVEQAAVGNQPVVVELVAQNIVLLPAAEELVAAVEAKIAANQCPAAVAEVETHPALQEGNHPLD